MKRLLSLLLSMTLFLSMAACSSTPQGGDKPNQTPNSQQTSDPTPEQTTPTKPTAPGDNEEGNAEDNESGKMLVVYFSAQNHTEAVAQTVAGTLEADIFEIIPAQPYTDADLNWRDENSRVCQEHNDPSLQTIELETTTPDNWADYDTVFIGYPIWWQNASWVVNSFVSANDFEGKTVYTFCTSSSSGLGESFESLSALANGGDWVEGVRFSSSVSADDVTEWLDGLGL